jgi:hypothetical protein
MGWKDKPITVGTIWLRRIRDGLTTIGAVWLAMFVASMSFFVSPGRGGELGSLLVYTALLAAYARWTGPGRRSAGTYFLAALFPPLVCFVILTPLLPHLPPSFLENGGAVVFVGLGVGIQAHGGPDMPIEGYLPLMWLNLLLPIVAVLGVRGLVRYRRD